MKQSRRHDLKTNELAESLRELKEWFGVYGNYVLGGVVVVLLVIGAASYYTRSRNAKTEQRWAQYEQIDREYNQAAAQMQQARVPDPKLKEKIQALFPRMEQLANSTEEEALVRRAWRWIGDRRVAIASISPNPKEATEQCKLAEEAYQRAIRLGSNRTFETLSAEFGLASLMESRGDFEGAKRIYQGIVDRKSPETEIQSKLAADKLEALPRLSIPVMLASAPPPTTQPTTSPASRPAAAQLGPSSSPTTKPTAGPQPGLTSRKAAPTQPAIKAATQPAKKAPK